MSLPPDITHLHLLTPREARSRLGLTAGALRDAVDRGQLTAYRTPGGASLLDADEIADFQSRHREEDRLYMTTGQVAEVFRVKKATVHRWARSGILVSRRQDRRGSRYDAREVQQLWDRLNPDASR